MPSVFRCYQNIISRIGSFDVWSSGCAFVSGAGGLRFKSLAGQIGHSLANGSPPLQHFFEKSCVAPGVMTLRWAPQARYTPRRNTASIMKELI